MIEIVEKVYDFIKKRSKYNYLLFFVFLCTLDFHLNTTGMPQMVKNLFNS
mgnify:CR=1 FL=1